MAIRVVRHIAGRSVDEGEAIPLVIIPYGAGERLRHIRMDAYIATRANSYADQPSEINWVAIDVPWSVLFTGLQGGTGGTGDLNTATEWDTMYRNLVLEYGVDGSEYYGGDSDMGTPDPVEEPGTVNDEPAITRTIGPSGIQRIFSREVLMRPLFSDGAEQVRYFDEFSTAVSPKVLREHGGAVLLGAVRYDVDQQANFGIEFSSDMAKGMKALIGGDIQRVQAMIQQDTSGAGDRLRTVLFGGDNYVEADTLKNDPAKAYLKVWCSIETPYRMGVI